MLYFCSVMFGDYCERCHVPDNVHIFIPGFSIHYRHKFCIQEVLLHRCLPPFYPNAFFGLRGGRAGLLHIFLIQTPFPSAIMLYVSAI